MTTNIRRVQPGIPSGGQFAVKSQSETEIHLDAPEPLPSSDEWQTGGTGEEAVVLRGDNAAAFVTTDADPDGLHNWTVIDSQDKIVRGQSGTVDDAKRDSGTVQRELEDAAAHRDPWQKDEGDDSRIILFGYGARAVVHTEENRDGTYDWGVTSTGRRGGAAFHGRADSLDNAKKAAADTAAELEKYGTRGPGGGRSATAREGMSTPWGRADYAENPAPGIGVVGTPGHGGVKLSAARNRQVHPALRCEGGWYEEDCDAANVIVSFPQHFSDTQVQSAWTSVRNYSPDAYEAVTGKTVQPGESYTRDKESFYAVHADDSVAVAARMDGPDHVIVTAARGGQWDRNTPDTFHRVPTKEYNQRNQFGFVVDSARHPQVG